MIICNTNGRYILFYFHVHTHSMKESRTVPCHATVPYLGRRGSEEEAQNLTSTEPKLFVK